MNHLLAELLSIGLAPDAIEIPYFTDEPKYPSYFYPKPIAGIYSKGDPYGMSLAQDEVEARARGLAEFYERLCLLNPRLSDPPAAWTEDSGWIDPVSLAGDVPSEERATFRSASYSWLNAIEVTTGRETKLPAQAVVPGFQSNEVRTLSAVGPAGASLGRQGEPGRVERGLFEVLERYTARTLSLAERFRQQVVTLPSEYQRIENYLRQYRLEPHVYWTPGRYSVPWVLVALTDTSGVGPALSYATRSAPTYYEAIGFALIEALERRRPARIENANRAPESSAPRVYPWETLEALSQIAPLMKNAATTPFADLPTTPLTAGQLLDRFAEDGLDVLSVDTTLPEVAAAGFEASKIVIPGLGPLSAQQ